MYTRKCFPELVINSKRLSQSFTVPKTAATQKRFCSAYLPAMHGVPFFLRQMSLSMQWYSWLISTQVSVRQ